MTRRKILLVDMNMFFGGGQVYLESLVTLLQDKATFYAFSINPKLAQSLRKLGIASYCFESIVDRGKPLHAMAALAMLIYVRFRYGIDTVWVNGIPDIVLLPLARLLGCKAFATRHLTLEIESQDWYRGSKRRLAELFYRLFAFAAHKIICVSQPVADDLRRYVPAGKLTVIPNWQPSLPDPVESRPYSLDPLRLLYVGRLQEYKGAYLIVEAMRKFKATANGGRKMSLTIVGEGRFREELERRADGLDVAFTGFQNEPSRFYRASDVFINPTIGPEGMPLVSLEAMSYGLPCIFSDLPVHRDISDDGESALLFRSGEAQDLLSKIVSLLSSQELLDLYGKRAREAIVEKHSAPVARSRYIEEIAL